jgi:cytochrome P450
VTTLVSASTNIPGPRALPLIGYRAQLMRFFGDPIAYMRAAYQTYGPVVALATNDTYAVLGFGPEYNRHLLTDAAFVVRSITEDAPRDSSLFRLTRGVTSMNGEYHRQQRRLIMPAFYKQQMEVYRDAMVTLTTRMLDGWPLGRPFDVEHTMQQLALHIFSKTLFGLDPATDNVSIGERVTQWLRMVMAPINLVAPYNLPGMPYRRLFTFSERIEAELLALIAEKRARPQERRDVLATLIHTHDEDGARMTDEELLGNTSVLFFAGYDTTANVLGWTLFLLAQHPAVLADLLDELDSVLHGNAPTIAQLERLPLLDRVLKESLRVLPPVPFVPRFTVAPTQVGTYTVPANVMVIPSMYVTHHMPDLYPEPERFRPDRWGSSEPSPFEFLPFGAGPHVCIGYNFALTELKIVLPMIVQRYRLAMAPGARIDRSVHVTLSTKHGMPMIAHPQDRQFGRPTLVRGNIHEMVDLEAA